MPETLLGDIAATNAKLNLHDFWLPSFAGIATTHLQARMDLGTVNAGLRLNH